MSDFDWIEKKLVSLSFLRDGIKPNFKNAIGVGLRYSQSLREQFSESPGTKSLYLTWDGKVIDHPDAYLMGNGYELLFSTERNFVFIYALDPDLATLLYDNLPHEIDDQKLEEYQQAFHKDVDNFIGPLRRFHNENELNAFTRMLNAFA